MKKSFIDCPYGCKDGDKPRKITISGMTMHVKNVHPDKYTEFKENFAELKKKAEVMDTATKTPAAPGHEPEKIDDKAEYKDKKEPPVKAPGGDDKPKPGKSFLRELDEYLDSPEF